MGYDIHLDVKFDPLTHIDLDAEAAAVEPWFNQTLTQVNDSVVRTWCRAGSCTAPALPCARRS
jgi:hypothetical protein